MGKKIRQSYNDDDNNASNFNAFFREVFSFEILTDNTLTKVIISSKFWIKITN